MSLSIIIGIDQINGNPTEIPATLVTLHDPWSRPKFERVKNFFQWEAFRFLPTFEAIQVCKTEWWSARVGISESNTREGTNGKALSKRSLV